jgi:TIGR03009 family protein
MKLRIGLFALFVSLTMAIPALAQTHPLRGPQPSGDAAGPDQPVRPQTPVIVPRARQAPAEQQPPAASQPLPPPFTLTPQEEAQVDQVLKQWEQHNKDIKTFDCEFQRWIYDFVFNPPAPNKPPEAKFNEKGVIRYAAPDRGEVCVKTSVINGKEMPIDDSRTDHWICDGKSVFEYKPTEKQVKEHKLPKEMQGKAIANSQMPFLFGAEAKELKRRYFIRVVTPKDAKNEIWLEAYPRLHEDAANFHHAVFIIKTNGMLPYGLQLVQPNGRDYTAYRFENIVVDDPFRMFKGDPFRAHVPLGWQMVPDDVPQASQARRPPDGGQR